TFWWVCGSVRAGQIFRFGRGSTSSNGGNGGMREQAQRLAQVVLDFAADVRVFLQENAGVIAALAQAFVLVRNPGAGFFEQAIADPQVNQIALARDAFAVNDFDLTLAERCSNFVLYDLRAR